MRTHPTAADLLAIARATLLSTIMPEIPNDRRCAALMIADAIANAAREAAAGDLPLRAELDRLRMIYPTATVTDEPLAVQLNRFNRQLAVDLRKGTFDGDRAGREQVRTHLVQTAMERVRETNPEYLRKEGLE